MSTRIRCLSVEYCRPRGSITSLLVGPHGLLAGTHTPWRSIGLVRNAGKRGRGTRNEERLTVGRVLPALQVSLMASCRERRVEPALQKALIALSAVGSRIVADGRHRAGRARSCRPCQDRALAPSRRSY